MKQFPVDSLLLSFILSLTLYVFHDTHAQGNFFKTVPFPCIGPEYRSLEKRPHCELFCWRTVRRGTQLPLAQLRQERQWSLFSASIEVDMVFRHRLRCAQFAEAEFSGQRTIKAKTCSRRVTYTYLYIRTFCDGMTNNKADRLSADKIWQVPHFSRTRQTTKFSDYKLWNNIYCVI